MNENRSLGESGGEHQPKASRAEEIMQHPLYGLLRHKASESLYETGTDRISHEAITEIALQFGLPIDEVYGIAMWARWEAAEMTADLKRDLNTI